MSRKPLIQTRVERDTNEAIEDYIDNQPEDISQSEAVRHLLRAGLEQKGHPVAAADGRGPTTRTERTKETAFGWLERSMYALLLSLAGMLATGGSALVYGTTPVPYLWLGLAALTVSLTGMLSGLAWVATDLYANTTTTATTEEAKA